MNKAELLNVLAEKSGMSKPQVRGVLEGFFETIAEEVKKDNKIMIAGFGEFSKRDISAREVEDPKTKKKTKVPARSATNFRPVSSFRSL